MKYYLLISLLHLYCILSAQSSNCDNYTTYKTEAVQLAKQDPRLALMKYETMKKCDPARAQREGVDKDIVALFKDLIVAQEQAVANKIKAEEAKAAAIKAGKELDKALVKAYYAQAKSAYEAGEFKKALELSKKVQQLDPQKELGDLEPKLIESRIPDDRFCGEPLRDRGVLNNFLYGEAPCNALTNRKHNLRWDSIITRPVIEWDKDNSDMGYLFMLQKKENQSDYGELIILAFNDASEDETPKEVGRCRIPVADLQKWENQEYVHNRDGFFHIGEWGYFSENTANFAIFSPKNNTLKMFENTEFQYGGGEDNILAAFEKDGAVYVEQYGLPYLNFMDKYQVDENGDKIYAAGQITNEIEFVYETYKNQRIVNSKRLVEGRLDAAGVYLQDMENNKLSPILELKRGIKEVKAIIDSTREQVTVLEYGGYENNVVNFVVYDIKTNTRLFNWVPNNRTGEIMYKLDGSVNRLYTWKALSDSILTASNGAGTYVCYDGNFTRWNQTGTLLEKQKWTEFEYVSSGRYPKAILTDFQGQKAETPEKIALFEVWSGTLIKSWEKIVAVKTVDDIGENTNSIAHLLVEYTDPNNPGRTLTDLVFCADDSLKTSVLSLQNTPIETLYPIPGHYISKKNKPNGKAELSVYQLAYAKKFFPENIRFLGTIETDSLSNEDVTGDILTVQSNFKKGRLWDYGVDTSDIAFYQLPELKLIDTVQRMFSIGEFNSTHPALFIVRTINLDAKIYDPYKHLAFTRGNWGGFFEAFFLDSARTLLAVEYIDTLQSLNYSKLDILTYPGLKLQTTLNLTNSAYSVSIGYFEERIINQKFNLVPGSNLIYNQYFTVCADMIDSTASQTAYLYKVLPGKLQLLDRYKVRNNFIPSQITLSAINGPAPKEEKSEYESYAPPGYYEIVTPDQPVDIPVPEYETIQARYFSKKYMLHFEQEMASDAFNVNYYSLDPFALLKEWEKVDRIDSIDSKILKITFKSGEIEYFDTELKTKTDYIKPQPKAISNIQTVFENENLQITEIRDSMLIKDYDYSKYGAKKYQEQGVFQLLHKKSKAIKTWDIHTPYKFDAERERLVLFNYSQKNYEVCKDTLLIFDCKNGISEVDKIVGQALLKGSPASNNKNYWVKSYLKAIVSDSSTAHFLYIIESDNFSSPAWITLHTLDLNAAKNFHSTLKYTNKSELTILDKFGFLITYDGFKNENKTLQIFDLLKGKPINNTKWNLSENAQIHVLNPLIVGFEDIDSVYFMYDLEAMKVKAKYKSVASINQNDYGREQKYIGGNYWIRHNNIDKEVKDGDDFYRIKKFDLDIFGGLSFDKTILRLRDVYDFYFEGDLLFTLVYVQKEEGYIRAWKVYDAKQAVQEIGTWEDTDLNHKPAYEYSISGVHQDQLLYLSATNAYKKFVRDQKDTLTIRTLDYTLFKPDNPDFRFVLKDGIINGDLIVNNNYTKNLFFDFFCNQKSENMGDLQLFRSDDLTPAGLWKDVNKSSKPVVINDSILLVQYNYRNGIYDLDLKILPSMDSIRTYRGISDWTWLPADSGIAIVRPASTDSANIAYSGELRGVNDNRLITAFILPFYFELANDPVDNSYRDEKDLDYNKLVFSTAVDLDEKYAEHLELREGYREKDYLRGVLGFRGGRAFLLPQGYITVDGNPMVVCAEQPYSISITKDEQDSELGKRYWNIQAYSYSTQDTDHLPEPVFKTPKRIEVTDDNNEPNIEFNKSACEIWIPEKADYIIYKLQKN